MHSSNAFKSTARVAGWMSMSALGAGAFINLYGNIYAATAYLEKTICFFNCASTNWMNYELVDLLRYDPSHHDHASLLTLFR